jgi:hypothetical protein
VTTEDRPSRAALAEGEEVLGKGAVSHNHLWFYCYAMQAALAAGEYGVAGRGRGRRDPATLRELRRLANEARRVGVRMALPALERAIA